MHAWKPRLRRAPSAGARSTSPANATAYAATKTGPITRSGTTFRTRATTTSDLSARRRSCPLAVGSIPLAPAHGPRRREGSYCPADVLTFGGVAVFAWAALSLLVEWITGNVMEVFRG